MCSPEEIYRYHCPRWNELPDLGLYMDQVVSIIEKHLAIIAVGEDQKIITPAMINNYVKHKVIPAPINKKYERRHVANLFVICLLKRFISLADIRTVKERMLEMFTAEECYNLFCSEIESSLLSVYGMGDAYEAGEGGDSCRVASADQPEIISGIYENTRENAVGVVKNLTSVCAKLIYANYLIKTVIASDRGQEG